MKTKRVDAIEVESEFNISSTSRRPRISAKVFRINVHEYGQKLYNPSLRSYNHLTPSSLVRIMRWQAAALLAVRSQVEEQ